jgi:hypothetical protein
VLVMMGPGPDDLGVGGRGHLRASHADREHVIDTLNVAFTDGRLTKDEFDTRVGQALVSRTYAALAPLTADIPVRPMQAPPPRQRVQRVRASVGTATVRSLAAGFAVIPPIIFFEAIFTSDNANLAELIFPLMLLELIFLTLAVGNTLLNRIEDRRIRGAGAARAGRLGMGNPAERHLH